MIEKLYHFTSTDEKIIERIVDDEHVNLNHVVLHGREALPEHVSNSNVYLVVIRGILSGRFGKQEEKQFPMGAIVAVPYDTLMNIRNEGETALEFFIIKAPHPDQIRKQA